MRGRTTGIIMAIGWAIIVMVAYPFAEPVVASVVALVISETTPTAFEEFILDSMPFWGLLVAFLGIIFIAIKGVSRE